MLRQISRQLISSGRRFTRFACGLRFRVQHYLTVSNGYQSLTLRLKHRAVTGG